MRAEVDEECVVKANGQFWEQMLGMVLAPAVGGETSAVGAGHVRGWVELTGAWQGQIEVRLARGLARYATAAMLMQQEAMLTEADVLDAVKEIANMIAGTIKSRLPRPCAMTVPESRVEAEETGRTAAAETLAVGFRHAAGTMVVRVLEAASA